MPPIQSLGAVALLQTADQELNVYVPGENSGLDDLSMSDVEIVTVNLDVHSVWCLGKHEVVIPQGLWLVLRCSPVCLHP